MRWPKPIDHLYVLCEQREEPDRAAYLKNWFATHGVDDSCWSFVNKCYGKNLSAADAHAAYNPYVDRKPVEAMRNFNSYNMKPAEISLCINWEHAARAAVKDGHKIVMIFESDVIFLDGFLDNLAEAMNILTSNKSDWDFLSISSGAGLRPRRPSNDEKLGWFPSAGFYVHTRTTDAMIFKVSMLEKIVRTFLPVAEVLDWELNYQLTLHESKTLWLDPPIVRQGSSIHTREYETTI
jgi:hypothetical protein